MPDVALAALATLAALRLLMVRTTPAAMQYTHVAPNPTQSSNMM
jgi:hypothetical protein